MNIRQFFVFVLYYFLLSFSFFFYQMHQMSFSVHNWIYYKCPPGKERVEGETQKDDWT